MDKTISANTTSPKVAKTISQEPPRNRSLFQYTTGLLLALAALVASCIWFCGNALPLRGSGILASLFFSLFFVLPPILGTMGANGFRWRPWIMVPYLLLLLLVVFGGANWYLPTFSVATLAAFVLGNKRWGLDGSLLRASGVMSSLLIFATVLGNLLTTIAPPYHLRRLLETRSEFPIRDLSRRLEAHRQSKPASQSAEAMPGNELFDLVDLKSDFPTSSRRRAYGLAMLHDREHERFVRALGFGVGRMAPFSGEGLELPAIEDIPFTGESPTELEQILRTKEESGATRELRNHQILLNPIADRPISLSKSLFRSYVDFFNPPTFGYVFRFQNVAGFQPHAFRFRFPMVEHRTELFELRRLELVSLLRFDSPRVYVLDHLPRMDQLRLKNAATRDLNAFETKALLQLANGRMIVVEETTDRIQMLGALRALDDCLQCHDCQPLDLLGAFSYELVQSRRKE